MLIKCCSAVAEFKTDSWHLPPSSLSDVMFCQLLDCRSQIRSLQRNSRRRLQISFLSLPLALSLFFFFNVISEACTEKLKILTAFCGQCDGLDQATVTFFPTESVPQTCFGSQRFEGEQSKALIPLSDRERHYDKLTQLLDQTV